ncbi:MAG TPA: beta-ketoacyl-[acyl-carrier-protein] synthase family protein [Verrucomicrobiae bacterium]|nr:beta-ketoacyl-[acyl-carrier-protein] synthase family protein [Verrucomicrobiae bacterium]
MAERFPVITGIGIVAAPGANLTEVWQAVANGACGLKPLSLFQSPRYGQVPVGEIRFDLRKLGAPLRGSRSDKMGWLAARDAIADAKLNISDYGDRAGVLLGCSVGGSFDSEQFLINLMKRGIMRPRPTRFHECVSAIETIADHFGLYGPSMGIATACSSGALAIAAAAEMIQTGEADVMLAGGTDSLSRTTWSGFHSLLLVDSQGCRPFDVTRGGMSFGEGAAVLVLENEETARKRGATIIARLTGWGASCDAHHATQPHPDGAGALAAMKAALHRANLPATAIDYVNAHGTGTRDNDLAEAKALKTLFGDKVPPFSSTKRIFGHALAASGALEAVVCIEALRRQQLPPNPGYFQPDPAIGLEPVTKLRPASLTHVMSNSFGFGGNNGTLIFSLPDTQPQTRPLETVPVAITGIGMTGPGKQTTREIEPPMPADKLTVHSCGQLDTTSLTPNQRRRLSRIIQMALLAARRCPPVSAGQRVAVALGTALGSLDEGSIVLENWIAKDEREPMPARFPGSVHNAAAAQIAIDLAVHGLNSAPTTGSVSFECALWQGMCQLAGNQAEFALVGAVDELNKYPLGVGKRWGFWSEQTKPGEGAVLAQISNEPKAATQLARVTAIRIGRYRRPFDAKREADWILAAASLKNGAALFSGSGGWAALDEHYQAVIKELSSRTGHAIEHRTYKQDCGEFGAASAFGFAAAIDWVRQTGRGALLYTLCPRGGKAVCCIEP